MHTALLLFISFLAFAFWVVITSFLPQLGGWLNPFPIISVYLGWSCGLGQVLVVSFFSGLVKDGISQGPLGIYSCAYVVTSVIAYYTRPQVSRDSQWVQGVGGLAGAILMAAIEILLVVMMGSSKRLSWDVFGGLCITLIFNAAIAPAIFWSVDNLSRMVGHDPSRESEEMDMPGRGPDLRREIKRDRGG